MRNKIIIVISCIIIVLCVAVIIRLNTNKHTNEQVYIPEGTNEEYTSDDLKADFQTTTWKELPDRQALAITNSSFKRFVGDATVTQHQAMSDEDMLRTSPVLTAAEDGVDLWYEVEKNNGVYILFMVGDKYYYYNVNDQILQQLED